MVGLPKNIFKKRLKKFGDLKKVLTFVLTID